MAPKSKNCVQSCQIFFIVVFKTIKCVILFFFNLPENFSDKTEKWNRPLQNALKDPEIYPRGDGTVYVCGESDNCPLPDNPADVTFNSVSTLTSV
jgi:hypothetical protein